MVRILQRIRSLIFGIEDGLVSMWGLVVGVSVGSHSSQAVILAGAVGAVSAALSMAAGEYLSSKAKREVQNKAIKDIKNLVKKDKQSALKRLQKHYQSDGFSKQDAVKIINIVKKRPQLLIHKLLEAEGYIEEVLEQPLGNATAMFGSFMFASLFPIAPFFLLGLAQAQQVSLVATGIMLFIVGAAKSEATSKSWISSGAEMLFIGGLAGLAGYLIGGFFA